MALISDEDSATARRWKWKKSSTHIIKKKKNRHNLSQDLNTAYLWLQAYKKKKEEKKASLLKLGSMGWLDVSA